MRSLVLASLFLASPAVAGPDFVTPNQAPRPHAASDGRGELGPFDDVVFDHDSHALLPAALDQLAAAAAWQRNHPEYRLVLEGYADSSGTARHNADLAERRATLARNHLMALGVPRDQLVVVVYGEAVSRRAVNPLDRRVVLYATRLDPLEVVATAKVVGER